MSVKPIQGLQAGAETAVETYARVEPGATYASERAAASDAVEALRRDATAAICPDTIPPMDAAIVALLFDARLSLGDTQPVEMAARFHERAIGWPALAQAGRSAIMQDAIEAAAYRMPQALALSTPAQRAAHAAAIVQQYQQRVAAQLAGRGLELPASEILGAVLPALDARIAEADAQQDAHRRAETERIERERKAQAAALAAAEKARRDTIAEWFRVRADTAFLYRNQMVSGRALGTLARGDGARDANGDYVVGVTLSELELIRVKHEAAEQAGQVATK